MGQMSSSSPLGEKVRAAVACFEAAEPAAEKLYVLLEAAAIDMLHDPRPHPVGAKRVVVRRIYAGENKHLAGTWTVLVGHDLSEATPIPVSIPVAHRNYEVTVRAAPFGGADIPFEGVFDLRAVEIDKTPR
jgi:hypothetical protein